MIKIKHGFSILFTIPFWIIIIYLFQKYFCKTASSTWLKKKKININFPFLISCFLVLSVLISGLFCLFLGIYDIVYQNQKTKNYDITNGYLKDATIYHIDDKENTYQLIYEYEVNNIKYIVKTDYGVTSVPKTNHMRQVKYNPSNPKQAVLVGTNKNIALIYFGAFFVMGGMVFVLIFLQSKGVFEQLKIDILGIYVGFVFVMIGMGIIFFQTGMNLSLKEIISMMKFWILIPIMFLIVGILQILKSVFYRQK